MRGIAHIFVFTLALGLGAVGASLFEANNRHGVLPYDVPPPELPVVEVNAQLTAESLLGTWTGTWDHNDGSCTIEIDRVVGNYFYGVLRKEEAVILFSGTFNPKTRMLYFEETKVVSLGSYGEWSLGKNSGYLSEDGRSLVGIGHDKWGQYDWAVTNH